MFKSEDDVMEFFKGSAPREIDAVLRKAHLGRTRPRGFWVACIAAAVIWGMGGLHVVSTRSSRAADDRRLDEAHRKTTGDVLMVNTHRQKRELICYEYHFQYKVEDVLRQGLCSGKEHHQQHAVVSIEYLEDDPDIARIEGCTLVQSGSGSSEVVVFAAFLGFAALLPLFLYYRNRGPALLKSGTMAMASVETVDEITLPGGTPWFEVRLSFRPEGEEVQASCKLFASEEELEAAGIVPGSAAAVLYRPERPRYVFLPALLLPEPAE